MSSAAHCLEVTNRRKGGKAAVVTLHASGVGTAQREETFPILEGSGSFHPQRQDKAVMRIREWKLSAAVCMCLLSLHGGDSLEVPTIPTAAAPLAEGQANCAHSREQKSPV